MTAPLHFLTERYLSVDRRVLAAFRITMGVVLLVDVLRRIPFAAMLYSDAGVLPTRLARAGDEEISLFFLASTPREATIGMLLCAGVYLAYLVGFRTRVAQILAFVAFTSLNGRNLLVENRGHVEIALALMWTLVLPLGDRCSIDALRRPLSAEARQRPVTSLAVLAITLQVVAIYGLNAWQKGGAAWESGQAVHYVLWQNRAATSFAAWLRQHEPAWFSPFMTYGTRVAEAFCALAAISPIAQRHLRTLLLVVALWLHLSIAISINVWPHSFIILAIDLLLLPPAVIDRLANAKWLSFIPRPAAAPTPSATPPSSRVIVSLREGAVLFMLVAALLRISHDNPKLPDALRADDIGLFDPLTRYPRLFQRWAMFAEMPTTDGTVVVDAITADGRRIDPLTGSEPDLSAPLNGPWLLSQLQCDYYPRLERADDPAYVDAFVAYLTRWHELEDRPSGDRLVSFQVYWISSDSPPYGETVPRNVQRRLLASYPEPE
ncbi:MAG: hypothetical protein HOV80_28475 [Polyangiaceae bacterium]|nr:hypothetical protein [Polyangiaceae bacterium]